MKALVLAGGTGSRLRPFSHSSPKQLIPVAGKPVLFHGLESVRAAGITDVGIVVNATDSAIRRAVGDGSGLGIDVTYIPQPAPSGLAHCVMIAKRFLGDDDFLMYLGDNIFSEGIAGPVERFQAERSAARLVVVKVADPSEYGVAEMDSTGRIVGLEEKPLRPRGNLAVAGAYVFSPQVHEAIARIRPSWRNELEITDAVQWLVAQDRDVRASIYTGDWKDTGNVGDLIACNRVLMERISPGIRGDVDPLTQLAASVVIEKGATVTASRIDGPTIIGSGTVITDSYIGPYTAIGNGCTVENAAVEDSILLDRSSIRGVRSIKGSLIGRDSSVVRASRDLHVHQLIMGDDSRIEVPV